MATDEHPAPRQAGLIVLVRMLALRVLLPLVLIGVLGVVALGLAGVTSALTAGGFGDAAVVVQVVSMCLVLALPCLLLLGVVVWRFRSERAWYAKLGALGLRGSSYMVSGKQFHGELNGRVTEVFLGYGPVFELFMEGDVGTRIRFGLASGLVDAVQGPGQPPPEGLEHLHIQDTEREWLTRVLAADGATASLAHLTGSDQGLVEVYFRPDGIIQRVRGGAALRSLQEVADRSVHLAVLLRAAEAQRPEVVLEATVAEQRRGRRWGLPGGVWVLVGLPMLGVVTLGCFAALAVSLLLLFTG